MMLSIHAVPSERQQREEHRQRAGADAGDEIKLQKVARAPDPLELGAEHPQREHVEQDVKDPAVQEHVRGGLPDARTMLRTGPGGAGSTHAGCNPNSTFGIGKNAHCATNIATFAPISALSVVESGPGPKEKDEP